MLKQLLTELGNAESAVNLSELSLKLGVERSALDGMIAYLVQTGKLQDDEKAQENELAMCGQGGCASCPGVQNCPFVLKMPRTFSIPASKKD
ncbi:MAG: FeoC-like transcriptional regulator [Anaerolineaceae bacterium]|nr:FeoC-like transcriptional regulator [Anaerolineaceae bacterium]